MNNTNTTYFSETQRFRQWWIWCILLIPSVLLSYGLFQQLVLGLPFGKQKMSDIGLLLSFLATLLLPLSFFLFKLETRIDAEHVEVRFYPFHLSFRRYPFSSIQSMNVRTYAPISEYGGWGLRGWGEDRAFNVSGNKGLQLVFRDGRKLLIGTNKAAELEQVLRTLEY